MIKPGRSAYITESRTDWKDNPRKLRIESWRQVYLPSLRYVLQPGTIIIIIIIITIIIIIIIIIKVIHFIYSWLKE